MFSYLLIIALAAIATAEPIRLRQLFPDGRIVGGQNASIENYPYQVSLQYFGNHHCGGSIISEYYIITAAHCLYDSNDTRYWSVRAGTHFSAGEYGASLHQVEKAIQHENYGTTSAGVLLSDLAVIKVKQPFVFSETVQPINMYESGEESSPGVQAVITGWGATYQGGTFISQLQTVSIPIICKELCNNAYDDGYYGGLHEGQICAAYYGVGGKDACQGDSGGPLAIDGRLAGIVSWGNGCALPYYPGVYTEVAYYREWININAEMA